MSQSINKHYQRFQLPIMNGTYKPKPKNNKIINQTADVYLQSGSKNRFNSNHAPLRTRNNYETLKSGNRKSIQIQPPTKNITIQPNSIIANQQRTYYKKNTQNARKNNYNRRYQEEDIRGSSKSPYLRTGQGRYSSLNRSSNKIKSSNYVKYSNNLGQQLYKQPRSSLSQHYDHYQTSLHKRRVSAVQNTTNTNSIGQQKNYILEEAKEFYKNNKYQKSIQLLKKYLKHNHQSIDAHYFLGMSCINNNDIMLGISELEECLALDPLYKKSLYLMIALAYKKINKLHDSIDILTKGIEYYPQYYDCIVYRGKMYLKIHKAEAALKDFDKAIKVNQSKGFAYIGKGTALKELGKIQQAIKIFQKGFNTDMKQSCIEKRALCYYQNQNYELALKDFLRCQSSAFTYSYIMGMCYYYLNKPIQSILCFQQSLKNDTNQETVTSSVEMMMRIKIEDKDFYEAYHILNRTSAFEINKNTIQQWRIFLEGVLFMMKKKYRDGIIMFRQFLELQNFKIQYDQIKNNKHRDTYTFLKPLVYLYKAFGQLSESNVQNAKQDYKGYEKLAIRLQYKQQNLSKLYNMLIIEAGQIFPNNCLELIQKATNLIPNKPEPHLFLAFERVQNKLEQQPQNRQQNIQYIVDHLTNGINNLPQLSNNHISSFYFYRSVIHLYKGDFNKAISDVDKAIQKSEDNIPKYFYLRGLIFAIFGNFSQAVQDLSVAISLDEKYAKPYLERAKCLQIQGNSNDAFLDLQKYITLAPQDPYIHKYAGFLLFQNCAYEDCLSAFSHGNQQMGDHQMMLTKAKCHFLLNHTNQCLNLFKKFQEETVSTQYTNDIALIQICNNINSNNTQSKSSNIQIIYNIINSITNQQQQCKIFKIRDMHQIIASIYLIKHNYQKAVQHLKQTLHFFRQEKRRQQQKQFIEDQEEFQNEWSEVQIQFNIAIAYLCEKKYADALSIFYEFQKSPQKGRNWDKGILLTKKLLNNEQFSCQQEIQLDVFQQNHRISKNWPKIKLPDYQIQLSLAFSYPFVEPPEMLPEFDQSLLNDFHMKKIQNKPEAPWINRQEKGLVFTPNIQVFDNLQLSVTTKKNNQLNDDDSERNKPVSDIDHSVQLSNSEFQMQAQALKQKFKLDSLVQMRLKKLMDKKNES